MYPPALIGKGYDLKQAAPQALAPRGNGRFNASAATRCPMSSHWHPLSFPLVPMPRASFNNSARQGGGSGEPPPPPKRLGPISLRTFGLKFSLVPSVPVSLDQNFLWRL